MMVNMMLTSRRAREMGSLYSMGARLSICFWWGASVPQCGKGGMFFGVAFRMVKKSPENRKEKKDDY